MGLPRLSPASCKLLQLDVVRRKIFLFLSFFIPLKTPDLDAGSGRWRLWTSLSHGVPADVAAGACSRELPS